MFYFTIAILLLVYGGETFFRNAAWKNAYTLYETDTENAPESAHLHSLFAATSVQLIKEKPQLDQKEKRLHVMNAEKHYLEAIRIIPNYISVLNNLGMVYYTFYNQPDVGIPYFEKALELTPDNKKLASFIAQYYQDQGNLKKANFYYDLMSKSSK